MSASPLLATAVLATGLGLAAAAAAGVKPVSGAADSVPSQPALPPSPWRILDGGLPPTPPIDATPICVASDLPSAVAAIALVAREDLEEGAKRLEARHARTASEAESTPRARGESASLSPGATAPESEEEERAFAWLEDLLAARRAREAAELDAAVRRLRHRLAAHPSAPRRACLHAELARLELKRGRYPEAAAHARLAERLGPEADSGTHASEAARFLYAEALWLAGRHGDAEPLERVLSGAGDPRLAAAARLRLADAALEDGEASKAWNAYRVLLPRGQDFGLDVRAWELRAAEAALAAGDHKAARALLLGRIDEGGSGSARRRAALRLGDLLALEGRVEEARERIAPLAELKDDPELAQLAAVRLVALGLSRASVQERLATLERAVRSTNRRLAQMARGVLAHERLEQGQAAVALDHLTRLAFAPAAPDLVPQLQADLDRALERLSAGVKDADGCRELVTQIGWRREFLIRHASVPEPFLRLADCYERLKLPREALDLYRLAAKRFAGDVVQKVELPLARAALAAGEVAAARVAAQAHVRRGGPQAARWKLLLAQAELQEGHAERAARWASELVRRGEPADDPASAIALLARALARRTDLPQYRALLDQALTRLQAARLQGQGPHLGELALLAADAHRRAGDTAGALHLYRLAAKRLPPGVRRAEAEYWLAALTTAPVEREEALRIASGTQEGGGWSRLAELEQRIDSLRRRIGLQPILGGIRQENRP